MNVKELIKYLLDMPIDKEIRIINSETNSFMALDYVTLNKFRGEVNIYAIPK